MTDAKALLNESVIKDLQVYDVVDFYGCVNVPHYLIEEAIDNIRTIAAHVEAQEAEIERLTDKVDGLESELDSAVKVALNHGAVEWATLNFPTHPAVLSKGSDHEKH